MVKDLNLTLPWPPSVNHYWRHSKRGHYISAQGRQYRDDVYYFCSNSRGMFDKHARLSVRIEAYPPDRRKRDLDNVLKSLLDSLQHAAVYEDDNQIDYLYISRQVPLLSKVDIVISICN